MAMRTILLIDDNLDILENLKEAFELEGYCIRYSSSGTEGIRLAADQLPDLVICDILMPDISGLEVLKELQKLPGFQQIPFVFCTCLSESKEIAMGLSLGADDYIIKPFDFAELIQKAGALIRSGSSRRKGLLV